MKIFEVMGMRQVRRCRQAQRERENQRRRESMQKQWKKKHDRMEVIQRDRGDKKRLNPKNIFMNSLLPEDSSRVTVRPTGCEAFSLLYLVTPQSGLQLQSQTKPLQRACPTPQFDMHLPRNVTGRGNNADSNDCDWSLVRLTFATCLKPILAYKNPTNRQMNSKIQSIKSSIHFRQKKWKSHSYSIELKIELFNSHQHLTLCYSNKKIYSQHTNHKN